MSFLEDKIKQNKDFFNHQEPEQGHIERFISRLDESNTEQRRPVMWGLIIKIAAVALILLSVAYLTFKYSIVDFGNLVAKQVSKIEFPKEINDVFAYYDAVTNSKVDEIDKLTITREEAERVKKIAKNQLQNLDANLAEIEKEYSKNPDNELLYAALINNKKKKAEIMDNIIKQLDKANNEFQSNKSSN